MVHTPRTLLKVTRWVRSMVINTWEYTNLKMKLSHGMPMARKSWEWTENQSTR